MEGGKGRLTKLALVVVFAALVFVATLTIRITIPATGGYFNIGEGMIFVAALLYGPFVGGLAGGIGAALVDAIGYPLFVPGTLIIKLGEGALVGYFGRKMRLRRVSTTLWRTASIFLAVGFSTLVYYIGTGYMGVFEMVLLNQILWSLIAVFLGAFIVFMSFRPGTMTSWQTIAITLGGAEMVIGYFLYEVLLAHLFPGMGIFALAEIPINIGQMLVGMTIALPVLRVVQRALPFEAEVPAQTDQPRTTMLGKINNHAVTPRQNKF